NWRAVSERQPLANLHDVDDLAGRQRPHRYNLRPLKDSGRSTADIGAIHRYIAAHLNVPHGQPRLQHGAFKSKRAAEQEGDQVVAPDRVQARRLVHKRAVLVNAIARAIGAHVGVGRSRLWNRRARLSDVEEWARPRIALAE